jgi:2-keto-3-deoxy-galactonokinase
VNGGTVEHFATFMTGELFDAVSRETILSHAVAGADEAEDIDAFKSAVIAAFETPAFAATCCSRCDRVSSSTAASHPLPAKKYRAR